MFSPVKIMEWVTLERSRRKPVRKRCCFVKFGAAEAQSSSLPSIERRDRSTATGRAVLCGLVYQPGRLLLPFDVMSPLSYHGDAHEPMNADVVGYAVHVDRKQQQTLHHIEARSFVCVLTAEGKHEHAHTRVAHVVARAK